MSEIEGKLSVWTAQRLGDAYFNPYESNFAVIPEWPLPPGVTMADVDDDDRMIASVPDLVAAEVVGAFQRISIDGGRTRDQIDFMKPLIGMRNAKHVFWPLGFLWGRSAIGAVDEVRFSALIAELYPELAAVRDQLAKMPTIARLPSDAGKRNFSFAYFKIFIALRFASSEIETIDDVRDEHMSALADVFKPDGKWAPWVSGWNQKMLRSFCSGIGEVRGDPTFGQAIGRISYLGRGARLKSPVHEFPHLQWVDDEFEKYLDERLLLQKKPHRRAKMLLLDAFAKCDRATVSDPATAFSRPNMQILLQVAATYSTPDQRLLSLGKVLDFGQWLSDNSRDESGVPRIIMTLTNADIDRFRATQAPATRSSGSEVAARPMPPRFHAELKKIIADDDFAWPKSLKSRQDGRPLHWVTFVDPRSGKGHPVFCEVLPRMLLLLLDLPLRGVQARRLDSGEGDEEMWNQAGRAWEPNSAPAAGYWRRCGAKNLRRGVLRRIAAAGRDGTSITGFYINSNKTQDRTELFDENAGYEIPWQFEEVIENLAAMREWQEKYNPVTGPLASTDTPRPLRTDDASEVVRGTLPDRFYLFRYPLNAGARGKEAPPTYATFLQFFYEALDELERRLNLADPGNPIRIINKRDQSGLPKGAIFTVHGMRSSTITSLYTEGVPIAVLSKLVAGHATILMTLKYVKYEPAHVNEILTEARRKALAEASNDFKLTLADVSYQEAARMTARLQDDGLRQMEGQYSEASAWSGMDIGICPNGGTLCQIGGERIFRRVEKTGLDKSQFKPVPGGARNCVRCRFFVTGLPFLIPLWGHANMLSAKAGSLNTRIEDRERELDELKRERHRVSSAGGVIPEELRRRIIVLETEWEADTAARDRAFADFHATLTYIEKVRAISRESPKDGDKLPMLMPADGVPEVTGRESTRFELSDAVVQMSRFFPLLVSVDLERERDQFLDRILYREGYIPISLGPLPFADRKKAADALAAFLLGQLGAEEAENLIQGKKTLADLGLQDSLEDVVRRTVGKPLEKLALTGPAPVQPKILDLTAAE